MAIVLGLIPNGKRSGMRVVLEHTPALVAQTHETILRVDGGAEAASASELNHVFGHSEGGTAIVPVSSFGGIWIGSGKR